MHDFPTRFTFIQRPEVIVPLEYGNRWLEDPAALRAAVLAHGMVVTRGWRGGEADFVELGRTLGQLERASPRDSQHGGQLFRVASFGTENVNVGRYWHCDGFAHSSAPALLTVYHVAKGVKASSGTAFVDGIAALARLSPQLRDILARHWWVHTSGSHHPFVLLHPAYQESALSVNLGKVAAIEGVGEQDLRVTVASLTDALDREPSYTHAWEQGDVLLVDNRRMLHHAPNVVTGKRLLWRVSVVKFFDEER